MYGHLSVKEYLTRIWSKQIKLFPGRCDLLDRAPGEASSTIWTLNFKGFWT